MSTRATATFETTSWDENPYDEAQGLPTLTRASVSKTYRGDVEGEGKVEYLMMYRSDSSATFVGLERFRGRLGGRAGSFVLQSTGTFEDGVARSAWVVVPGSGTDELRGLRGQGEGAAGEGPPYPFTLDYELE
ncbi:MAG TPA: DUF3224 domain-containing protein [Chloroflexota bacterium]|nr:DUF3224 domain-containing protein [Chloroflexota bacterium]